MRKLIWPVLFLFLLLVQGAASVFYTGWLAFDLPLVALYGFAVLYGADYGVAAGIFIGLLQDAMTTGIFGFHILTRSGVGYLTGLTKDKVVKDNWTYYVGSIGLVSFALRFCYWWVELIRTGWQWRILPGFFWDTLGYCVGNMLAAVPVIYLIKKIYEWVRKEDISY